MAKLRDGVIKRGATWAYVVRVTDPQTGRSKPRWVGGFVTEAQAKAARDEARVLARRGEYVDRSRITVAEFLRAWLETHAVEIKPRTLDGYRYLVEQYVVPRIGSMALQAVRPATISGLYRELLAEGEQKGRPLSARTVEYVHAVLRKAFGDAVGVEQLLTSNPVERAKRPRRPRPRAGTVWSTTELAEFLGSVERHRLFPLFRLAAYTGARRGELPFLRWEDVDLTVPEVNIRGTAAVIDGKWTEGTTKGGRNRRVSLDQGTVDVLAEHRRQQAEARLIVGPEWSEGGYVFTTGFGLSFHPDTVSQSFSRLVTKLNQQLVASDREALPHARFHDLRHVHATTLLLAGVPVHVVADRLGHADPSITLRVYAHVLHEHAAGVADVFASAVAGASEGVGDERPERAS